MTFTMLTSVLFLVLGFPAVTGDKHSLLYLYTIQSINSDSHLYDCTAVTLLNDRQIDFYNSSSDKPRTAKHNWLKIISESDWIISTEKLQYDRQLLNLLIDIQMAESGHSQSDVKRLNTEETHLFFSSSDGHVLQWRHGCEGEQSSDGSLTVLNCINEFGYDGEDLIQFNCTSKTWITPEKNREREEKNREWEEKKNREREEKWSKIFYAVRKCDQCEEMLKMYLQYKSTDITQSNTPPDVHIFAKKSVQDLKKLILTCMATGFYPKDVTMSLRKFTTEIPDHLITSSGVRPNDDETYQLRKSVEIQEDDKAHYSCYVTHRTLTEPVIKQWDERSLDKMIGVLVSGGLLSLCSVILCVLMIKKSARRRETNLCKVFEQISLSDSKGRRSRSASHSTSSSKDGRPWVLIFGGAVSGGVVLLCFVIPCILITMIIKHEISPDIMIGVLASGILLSLCFVILCVLMMKNAREEDLRKRHEQISLSGRDEFTSFSNADSENSTQDHRKRWDQNSKNNTQGTFIF